MSVKLFDSHLAIFNQMLCLRSLSCGRISGNYSLLLLICCSGGHSHHYHWGLLRVVVSELSWLLRRRWAQRILSLNLSPHLVAQTAFPVPTARKLALRPASSLFSFSAISWPRSRSWQWSAGQRSRAVHSRPYTTWRYNRPDSSRSSPLCSQGDTPGFRSTSCTSY